MRVFFDSFVTLDVESGWLRNLPKAKGLESLLRRSTREMGMQAFVVRIFLHGLLPK